MEDMNQNNNKEYTGTSNAALYFVALFVVVIAPFLLHFNLLYAPMQDDEFRLLLFDDVLHHPATAITALDRLPGSPLVTYAVGLLWWMGGGAMFLLRVAALLAFVLTSAMLFQTMRLWLNRSDTITAPLLCALLFAVSPVAAGALTALNAYPSVFGLMCASACALFFLQATRESGRLDYLCLVSACGALAVSVTAHHSLLLLPGAILALDLTRKTPAGTLRLSPAWTAHAALAGTSLAATATIYCSGGMFVPFLPPLSLYFLSCAAALILGWILLLFPDALPRRLLTLLLLAALPVSGILSFRQALARVEPVLYLEQQAASDDPASHGPLARHYLASARRMPQRDTHLELLQKAFAAWRQDTTNGPDAMMMRRALGESLLAAGVYEEAATVLEPFLTYAPFDVTGHKAAVAMARAVSEREEPARVADYYAFARRVAELSEEDTARYGKTLALLGNTIGAAMQFSLLPDLDESSEAGIHKKQVIAAYTASRALMETAREKMIEDPTDPSGYVASAEKELLAGDNLRAFYWLELALRRDPTLAQAWELMGVLFARHGQEEVFIAQWGAAKEQGDQAWLNLSRQSSIFHAWDAALTYIKQYVSDETPFAEEFMAAFAIELRRLPLAKEWFERATEAHPESYTSWLALADFAAAMQQPEEAQKHLNEAEKRNAPAEEITKRRARLEDAAANGTETRPFEPVRTLIQ